MSKKITISPINIDLGAVNTGVQYLHGALSEAVFEIEHNNGTCIKFNNKDLQFLQKERLATRHRTRTIQRRKLAKRLFLCVLTSKDIDIKSYAKAINFSNGLLNRRGFTYEAENLDEVFSEEGISTVFLKYFAIEGYKTLTEYFLHEHKLHEDEKLKRLEELKRSENLREEEIVEKIKEFDDEVDDKRVSEIIKKLTAYLSKVKENKSKGAQHRTKYFENIKEDISACITNKLDDSSPHGNNYKLGNNFNRLLSELDFSQKEIYNLLGNISNLQLRVLRKYFNNNPSKWDNEKLYTLIKRWIVSWHCKSDKEKGIQKKLLKKFDASKDILQLLSDIEPSDTIPPYEDQNNRSISKCASLFLNPMGLDQRYPQWEETVALLAIGDKIDISQFDNSRFKLAKFSNQRIDTQENAVERQKKAYILQRMLDTNSLLDPYRIRSHAHIKDKNHYRSDSLMYSYQHLSDKLGNNGADVKALLEFALQYYTEVQHAKVGIWANPETIAEARESLLYKCNTNPPRKNKLAHEYINNLLGSKLNAETLEKFKDDFWNNKENKIDRSQFRNFAKRVEELRKVRGNSFKQSINHIYYLERDKKEIYDTEVKKLLAPIRKGENKGYFAKLKEAVGVVAKDADKNPDLFKHGEQLYIISQIYNILETDINGFSKDCKFCIAELSWRMTKIPPPEKTPDRETGKPIDEVAKATRIFKDSVRPFDGYLGRYLERIATEIVQEKIKQIELVEDKQIYVPIFVEQNKFEFEEGLNRNKGRTAKSKNNYADKAFKSKNERIKSAAPCCPYCGKDINTGDVDHILPQSFTLKKYNTVFNGEANLIFTCVTCNRVGKSNKILSLADLSSKYLQAKFDSSDVRQIKEEITAAIEPFLKEKFINFINLPLEQQKYMRHALFVEDLRGQIIPLLNTRTKTMVNGTQAYLTKRINQKLIQEANALVPQKKIFCYPYQLPVTDSEYIRYTKVKGTIENNPGAKYPDSERQYYKEILSSSSAVSATRTLLALHDTKYKKQERQADGSHIIDASMVFATVLRNPQLLGNVLDAANIDFDSHKDKAKYCSNIARVYNDTQNLKNLENLLPAQPESKDLKRKKVLDGKNLWNKAIFKDTIYGEKFEPLVIKKDGTLCHGYVDANAQSDTDGTLWHGYSDTNDKNAVPTLIKDKDYKNLFSLLEPYLLKNNRKITHSYEEYLDFMERENREYLFFSIHKQKVFSFYEQTFYNADLLNLDADTEKTIKTLESMRFIFGKIDPISFLGKKSPKNYFQFRDLTDHQELYQNIENIIDATVKEQKELYNELISFTKKNNIENGDISSGLTDADWEFLKGLKQKALFESPFHSKSKVKTEKDVEEILEKIEAFHKKAKNKGKFTESEKSSYSKVSKAINKKILDMISNISSQKRKHKRVPTQKNIVSAVSPSGTLLRIHRHDKNKKSIFQVLVGGDNQQKFSLEKGTHQKKKVLLKELCKDRNIVPCDLLKWIPYKDGLAIEFAERDTTPFEASLVVQNEKIKKVICDPKNKKVEQWEVTLFFSESDYKEFIETIGGEQDKKTNRVKTTQKKLHAYLNEVPCTEEITKEEEPAKKKELAKEIAMSIEETNSEQDGYTVKFQIGSAAIRKCFNLVRPA